MANKILIFINKIEHIEMKFLKMGKQICIIHYRILSIDDFSIDTYE